MNYATTIARSYGISAVTMNSITIEHLLQAQIVIFCVSTWGKGTFPDNALEFWETLKASDVVFTNLRFAVLGLGSTKHKYYDQAGRDLFALLVERGARPIYELVEVDARAKDKGDASFMRFYKNLQIRLPLPATSPELDCKLKLTKTESDECEVTVPKGYSRAEIVSTRVVSSESSHPKIYEISIQVDHFDIASHIVILPQNSPEVVKDTLSALHLNGDDIYLVEGDYEGPAIISLQELFSQYLDLQGLPTQFLLHAFSKYVSEEGRSKLETLLSDHEALDAYLQDTSVCDFIKEFAPFGIPPLDVLVSQIPPMMSRTYSAASSPSSNARVVTLVITGIRFGNNRFGLASSFLSRCSPGDVIPVRVITDIFSTNEAPTILCGIGTGIAPMLSVLDDRKHKGIKGKCVLLFGSRHEKDVPGIVEKIESYKAAGAVDHVFYAFSRDHGDRKYYVTDAMKENSDIIWDIWSNDDAIMFYCGPAKGIAEGVKDVLEDFVVENMGLDRHAAAKYNKKHAWIVEAF